MRRVYASGAKKASHIATPQVTATPKLVTRNGREVAAFTPASLAVTNVRNAATRPSEAMAQSRKRFATTGSPSPTRRRRRIWRW